MLHIFLLNTPFYSNILLHITLFLLKTSHLISLKSHFLIILTFKKNPGFVILYCRLRDDQCDTWFPSLRLSNQSWCPGTADRRVGWSDTNQRLGRLQLHCKDVFTGHGGLWDAQVISTSSYVSKASYSFSVVRRYSFNLEKDGFGEKCNRFCFISLTVSASDFWLKWHFIQSRADKETLKWKGSLIKAHLLDVKMAI